jgi:hypothetical protein
MVQYHDGTQCTGFRLRYRLSDDWIFLHSIEGYRSLCEERLKQRASVKPLDARAVLYGVSLLNFVVQNIQRLDAGPSDVTGALACDRLEQFVVDIHRRWLMTPRGDLNGQSPREVLFAKRDLIDFDLDSRMLQWSYFLEEPPGLSRDCYAYQYAGFGTHEWVMYYDLVRFLIWSAVERMTEGETLVEREPIAAIESDAALMAELEELKHKWLSGLQPDLGDYIPAEVIDNERRRRPEAMTGRSIVIDEDCPCCAMMGDESEAGLGIYFRHFDGCNMEDEFAFSWYATLEEWEQEQFRWEEWEREWERKK